MEKLTDREMNILRYLLEGYDNSIAKQVFISKHTVKAHVAAILRKLQAKSRTQAVYLALKNNIAE